MSKNGKNGRRSVIDTRLTDELLAFAEANNMDSGKKYILRVHEVAKEKPKKKSRETLQHGEQRV